MTFNPQKILASKRALRRGLATLPLAEKLRMLDRLRERQVAIRGPLADKPATNPRAQPQP